LKRVFADLKYTEDGHRAEK